ncbi:glycoside hydrolase family 1 protein [Streptococcus ovuberis]|uniref:Glycoside hydrolase family 1 protein n=1 Tax=Streptococcus ovuberis TaxID=1936207 RepID=A0A7X6N0F0_9STRE|nr:glycoside hydrolase family 1 protein [Streptococcus ovuberis]NKZ20758.1 glycoside hydrolase family 1 protein [Streptococcus ovuberis]
MLTFPNQFLWGSSTSGPQSEGRIAGDGKGDNTWDHWFRTNPEKFHGGVGPEVTSSFYQNYASDLDLLVETGHTAFRTSIQWSRLIPDGDGVINELAVEFYRKVFQGVKDRKIELLVNLYHFDLPMALEEKGGWTQRATVEAYERYARTCFERFGDLVDRWITFNEPIVPVECGYFYQLHYPATVDPKAGIQVAYHTQLASSLAVRASHEINPDAPIGIVLNLTPAYPRSQHPADLKAARIAELFQAKSFLDPSVKGEYPAELVSIIKEHDLLPTYQSEDLDIIRQNTVDYLGVNYYQPLRVAAPKYQPHPDSPFFPEVYFDHYVMPGRKMNPHRGWEIYERGIYDIALDIKENYGNIEWILTENGMGVEGEEKFRQNGIIQDDYRIEFIKGHLEELYRAIQEGANCQGYLLWTFIDCWSWLNSYKNRYGLVELDLADQSRRLKKSGYWFKELSQNNGF